MLKLGNLSEAIKNKIHSFGQCPESWKLVVENQSFDAAIDILASVTAKDVL